MRTIVAGSRSVVDAWCVWSILDEYVSHIRPISVVISGAARGVDRLGEGWAKSRGRTIDRYPVTGADWNRLGKKAGAIRNRAMLERAEACLVVWDGQSPGSLDMATIARERIPTRLYRVAPHVDPQGYLRYHVQHLQQWDAQHPAPPPWRTPSSV